MLWQSIWFYFCVSFWKRGLLKSNFHSFRLLNIIRTTCWFFSLSKYVNTTYDVMAVLVFGFTSFYQYWLLILLQYQSPWANKTHTFNLLLLRKGGWLVAALKKINGKKIGLEGCNFLLVPILFFLVKWACQKKKSW